MKPRSSVVRTRLSIVFATFSLLLGATAPIHSKTVTLDHETLTVTPAGTVGLYPEELLDLVVTHTSRRCFTFNLTPVEEEGPHLEAREAIEYRDSVELPVIHHPGITAYEVAVTKKPNLPADLQSRCDRPGHTFRIPVETYEWGLALAGAFTGDKLTDPVYFLDEGVENPDAPPEMQRQGFFIRQSRDAEDSYKLGAAAMVHLFHRDPRRLDFKRASSLTVESPGSGAGLVHWAPLSFGLGVGGESATRYYLGTSLRFGQKAYLTAGWVFGSRDRLPNGLNVGSFTTESNALGSLGSQTDSAFFLGVSFDFLKVSPSSFLGAFQTAKPQPQGEERGDEENRGPTVEEMDAEELIRMELNATGDDDLFEDDAIFKPDFEGDRFCEVTITEDPPGVTVEVNLDSLVDKGVVTEPGADEDLERKSLRIAEVVAERVAAHLEGSEAGDRVTIASCSEP